MAERQGAIPVRSDWKRSLRLSTMKTPTVPPRCPPLVHTARASPGNAHVCAPVHVAERVHAARVAAVQPVVRGHEVDTCAPDGRHAVHHVRAPGGRAKASSVVATTTPLTEPTYHERELQSRMATCKWRGPLPCVCRFLPYGTSTLPFCSTAQACGAPGREGRYGLVRHPVEVAQDHDGGVELRDEGARGNRWRRRRGRRGCSLGGDGGEYAGGAGGGIGGGGGGGGSRGGSGGIRCRS